MAENTGEDGGAAVADEESRFTAMYDDCRARVWAHVVSRAGRQVADEVVSETFAVAWWRWADVPDPPLPWLLGVARSVLRDTVRAEVRRESFVVEALDHGGRADSATRARELVAAVRQDGGVARPRTSWRPVRSRWGWTPYRWPPPSRSH
ncbi:RNA polymerase sigma factor [Streptomyces sp. NPDC056716]|uniref:RNA polymerase sigma factor n=1 Tax=unclassified Streptomyces TaxID=2593676 RepID=UPI003680CE0C